MFYWRAYEPDGSESRNNKHLHIMVLSNCFSISLLNIHCKKIYTILKKVKGCEVPVAQFNLSSPQRTRNMPGQKKCWIFAFYKLVRMERERSGVCHTAEEAALAAPAQLPGFVSQRSRIV